MLQGLADRVKDEAGFSLRAFALAAAAGLSAATVIGFLIAALFVRVAHRYGPVEACLASAAVFLALTAALAIVYAVVAARRRRAEAARRAAEANASLLTLADPRIIMVGLQVAQAIGFKRLLPLLAVGGAGLALAARPASGRRVKASTLVTPDVL